MECFRDTLSGDVWIFIWFSLLPCLTPPAALLRPGGTKSITLLQPQTPSSKPEMWAELWERSSSSWPQPECKAAHSPPLSLDEQLCFSNRGNFSNRVAAFIFPQKGNTQQWQLSGRMFLSPTEQSFRWPLPRAHHLCTAQCPRRGCRCRIFGLRSYLNYILGWKMNTQEWGMLPVPVGDAAALSWQQGWPGLLHPPPASQVKDVANTMDWKKSLW